MNFNLMFRALAAGALLATVLATGALAQTVSQQPRAVASRAIVDLGNGPTQIMMLTGSAGVFTSQGSGLGSTSGSSTTLTLTASAAANPPCIGCEISGAGITPGTTVANFNGTTTITLSAAMTVASSTPLSWGKACPAPTASGNPPPGYPVAVLSAAALSDVPFYTRARMCMAGLMGSGAQFVTFAIGAH